MKEILGIILFLVCAVYGLRQAYFGRPAFKIDYWLFCVGIILSIVLLLS